jgi:8-oxo-dGTP pyrophosphatase MutT (NUDIX family)
VNQNPWQIVQSKVVYDNPWIGLTEYDVINPNGGKGIYGKVHFKNTAIGVLVLDNDWNTYIVGQYRFVLDQYSWEIPEGGGKLGTDPLKGAKRELLEETGLKADHWEYLLGMHLSNSVSDEWGVVFIARGLSQHTAMPEETEQLQVRKIPFDHLLNMVDKGEITDSLTVAAVYKVAFLRAQGRLK